MTGPWLHFITQLGDIISARRKWGLTRGGKEGGREEEEEEEDCGANTISARREWNLRSGGKEGAGRRRRRRTVGSLGKPQANPNLNRPDFALQELHCEQKGRLKPIYFPTSGGGGGEYPANAEGTFQEFPALKRINSGPFMRAFQIDQKSKRKGITLTFKTKRPVSMEVLSPPDHGCPKGAFSPPRLVGFSLKTFQLLIKEDSSAFKKAPSTHTERETQTPSPSVCKGRSLKSFLVSRADDSHVQNIRSTGLQMWAGGPLTPQLPKVGQIRSISQAASILRVPGCLSLFPTLPGFFFMQQLFPPTPLSASEGATLECRDPWSSLSLLAFPLPSPPSSAIPCPPKLVVGGKEGRKERRKEGRRMRRGRGRGRGRGGEGRRREGDRGEEEGRKEGRREGRKEGESKGKGIEGKGRGGKEWQRKGREEREEGGRKEGRKERGKKGRGREGRKEGEGGGWKSEKRRTD
ncbi:H/ACA ribonucleoprotein complex subunit 1, partial [Ophiophagus hannah]